MSHVFGYTIANDVSGRDWQKKRNGGQWLLGKTFDSFCPLGPVVDTSLDPSNLTIKSWINDDLMQDSNTKHLVFDIPVRLQYVTDSYLAFSSLSIGSAKFARLDRET